MVYNFNLPTTSHLSFQNYIYSSTHPALPQAASTARHALRIALKTHKRLSPRERETNLQVVLNALNEYIPYLFAINDGLSGKGIKPAGSGGVEAENIDITLKEEIIVEWRPVLVSSLSSILKSAAAAGTVNGAKNRLRGRGIDFEIAFVIGTLGYVLSNMARVAVLRVLYAPTTPTADQKAAAMQNATRLLLQADSAHTLLAKSFTMSEEVATTRENTIPQLNTTVHTALASLALAEATLLAVLKDDAYTFACIQARNPNDKEWMVRAPEIPKVRALILARLCVRSAEHAEQALSGLGSVGASRNGGTTESAAARIDEDLVKYVQDVIKVSRAKACRFFGVDAELGGKVGEAIAWLRAGKGALGIKRALIPEGQSAAGGKLGGLSKLKKGWSDRRDERRLEKSSSNSGSFGAVHGHELSRGDDAGWEEEGRVIEMLEAKWVKMNNTVSHSVFRSLRTSLLITV